MSTCNDDQSNKLALLSCLLRYGSATTEKCHELLTEDDKAPSFSHCTLEQTKQLLDRMAQANLVTQQFRSAVAYWTLVPMVFEERTTLTQTRATLERMTAYNLACAVLTKSKKPESLEPLATAIGQIQKALDENKIAQALEYDMDFAILVAQLSGLPSADGLLENIKERLYLLFIRLPEAASVVDAKNTLIRCRTQQLEAIRKGSTKGAMENVDRWLGATERDIKHLSSWVKEATTGNGNESTDAVQKIWQFCQPMMTRYFVDSEHLNPAQLLRLETAILVKIEQSIIQFDPSSDFFQWLFACAWEAHQTIRAYETNDASHSRIPAKSQEHLLLPEQTAEIIYRAITSHKSVREKVGLIWRLQDQPLPEIAELLFNSSDKTRETSVYISRARSAVEKYLEQNLENADEAVKFLKRPHAWQKLMANFEAVGKPKDRIEKHLDEDTMELFVKEGFTSQDSWQRFAHIGQCSKCGPIFKKEREKKLSVAAASKESE